MRLGFLCLELGDAGKMDRKLVKFCSVLLAGVMLLTSHLANAQYTYTQSFTGASTSPAQCTAWNTYLATLPSSGITGFTIKGSLDPVGVSCTSPSIAQSIANALRLGTTFSGTSDGQNWIASSVCCGAELSSTGAFGGCTNPGYTVRPCIGNVNWGGIDGLTCGAPSQTMTVIFNASTIPTFDNGSTQSLSVCKNSTSNDISALLTATDVTGATFTWSVTSVPSHGTVSGLPQSASTGSSIAPVSVTYTPTTGYIGSDAFTIQVSNGGATASTTINVTVGSLPTISAISPIVGTPLSGVTITGTNFNSTAGSNIVYFGSTRASVLSGTSTSLSVTVPNDATYSPVTVNNAGCNAQLAYSFNRFLPTYNNAAYAPNTVNFAPHTDFSTGLFPNHIAYGDIDGDGKIDIITNNFSSNSVSIFRNTSTSGSVSFASAVTLTGITSPGLPSVGDIDGDGLLDLACPSASGNIQVFRNTSTPGTISFASAVIVPFVVNSNCSFIADIDGDGHPDLIGSSLTTMSVWVNTSTVGSISFTSRVNFTAPANINSVTAGDVDGDGKLDILTAQNTSSVSVWRNTSTPGSVTMAARQDFTTPGNTNFVGLADIDGDGKKDIVSANSGSSNFSVFPGTSISGTISVGSRQDFTTGATPNTFSIGDFDGDGKPDVAVSSISGGNVGVFRNTSTSGSFSFATRADFASGSQAAGLVAADIDGDGKMDLTVTNQGSTNFSVLLNSPLNPNTGTATVCPGLTTTLSNSYAFGGTWASSNTAVATVVGGTGVVTGVLSGTANITFTSSGTAQTVVTTVTVTAAPTVTGISPVVGFPSSSVTITGTNFNTTSTNDIVYFGATRATVTTASATSLSVTVPLGATFASVTVETSTCGLQANSIASFLQDYNNTGYIANTVNFDQHLDISTGTGPFPVAIGDIDGDGKSDIVVGNYSAGTISVYRNTSTSGSLTAGSFAALATFTVGTNPADIAIGDIDGDGKMEVVVANNGSSNVSVLRNLSSAGSISFATQVTLTTGTGPGGVKIGDLDGDGKPDIATANEGASNVSVLRNLSVPGTISFVAHTDFSTGAGSTPQTVYISDIDGDGKADLVTGNAGLSNVSVLRNTSTPGALSFVAHSDFASGANPDIAVADIDGDGKQDIIAANDGSTNISVLRNTSTPGTVSFSAQVVFAAGSAPSWVAIGDADGDGKPDVFVINTVSNTVSVLRNTATSGTINAASLATHVDFPTSTSPFSLAVGDLDGDGKADIVATDFATNNMSVLRNDPLQAITGTFVVCQNGPTSTLSDAAPGGLWTSSNTAIATVGSTTGIVQGLAGGTVVITYQGTANGLTTGNYTTQTVTVNAQSSAAFTATPNFFCVGLPTTFNNAAPSISSYAWNFDDGTTATGNNPPHTYATAGNYSVTLTVTNTNGCSSSAGSIVTVNPLPAGITGTLSFCTGYNTTLSDATPGGVWSSATAGISIGSSSGIVTSPSTAGTSVITYSVTATGCTTTTQVTVNQTPAAIGGPTQVCVNSNITLTDTYLPGTGVWSSSNAATGSIVATTGVLTGVATGTNPIITYAIPATGCYSSATVTVNPLPAGVTGTLALCSGQTSALSDATPGGSWTSGTTSVATVGTSGVVIAAVVASTSTSVITYTLPTTCIAQATVTVNPLPSTITGTTNICTGTTTTLTSSPGTGLWTSSDGTRATVTTGPSATTTVTGVAAGPATITYTLPTGCTTTQAMTINQTPAAIGGTAAVCVGLTTALSDATSGGTWSSSIPADGSVSTTGVATGVSAAGNPNIIYTIPATGCSAQVQLTVNPLPAAITSVSSFSVCMGASTTLSDATSPGTGVWTSNNATYAPINSSTGVVNGLATGSVIITYTLPTTGCAISAPFTVNPVPASITGASSVCSGLTTTFTDATTGGTWTSAASGTASVNSTSGLVTGNTPGSTNIIYTLPAGCSASKAITVNPQPATISGTSGVCMGQSTAALTGPSGGTWSSSNTAVGTISSTGIVTGIAAGTINISYTLPAGCFTIFPFTVNPVPAAITGPTVVCAGSTMILSDVSSGGTWSSGDVSRATVNSSGVVTGVAAGNPMISYTLAGSPVGCSSTYVITVNPVPNITTIGSAPSATSQCANVSGTVTVTSSSIVAGTYTVTYNLSGANSATATTATFTMGGSGSGTLGIPASALATPGATTVTLTQITNSFGCTSAFPGSYAASFTVYPYPTAYTVTGTGSFCSGGAGVHVILSNSDGGISYQLYNGGVATGPGVAGTFAALDMGAQTTGGTYTVIGTNTSTLCSTTMTGSAVITVNPLPTAFAMTGGGSYCAGGTGVTMGLANSTNSVNYQLYNGGTATGSPVAGTGGAISFGLQTAAGTYTVIATNAVTGCTNSMTGSAAVTVNPVPAAITGTSPVCAGQTVTLADATAGGRWTSINTAAATVGTGSGVVTGVAAGTSVISYTLPTGCAVTTIATVNALPAAILGAGTICSGNTLTLTDATGGGSWTSSNTLEATIDPTLGVVTGVAAGNPMMTYTTAAGCIATVFITVNTTPVAISGTLNVCPGTTTLLTDATPGGTWGISSSTFATISTSGLVTGVAAGSPTVTYTLTGCIATATVVVNPLPGAISGTPNVCAGANATLNDATTGGTWSSSNPAYGTVAAGSGSTGIVTGISAGILTISYTLPTGCYTTTNFTVNAIPAAITGTNTVCAGLTTALGNTVTGGTWTSSNTSFATVNATTGAVTGVLPGSPTITYTLPGGCFTTYGITVNPNPASIAGANNTCIGSSTVLTDATPGGTWSSSNSSVASIGTAGLVTGVAVGSTTIAYLLGTGCVTSLTFTVNPLPSAIAGTTNVCAGSTITLSSSPAGGTWTSSIPGQASVGSSTGVVTGVSAGNPNITYTLPTGCIAVTPFTVNPTPVAISGASTLCTGLTTTLSDGTVGGVWTSSDLTRATVGSSSGVVTGTGTGTVNITYTLPAGCIATMAITVNLQPAAVVGANTVCTGLTTTLTDATTGGVWTSSNTATATVGSGTGVVTGVATGLVNISYTMPGGCASVQSMTVNQQPVAIVGINKVCVGLTTTLTDASIGGVWSSSDAALGAIGSATGIVTGVSYGPITITYTLPGGCISVLPFTVNPLPAAITGPANVCVASTLILSDVTAGGNWSSSNPSFATIDALTGTITGISAGSIVFTYTLPTGCIATISGSVNPLPTLYSVTGGGAYCSGGSGVRVGLGNSATGISYQLYYNNGSTNVVLGSPISGSGSAISFGLQTGGGTYTILETNTSTGCNILSSSATVLVNATPTAFVVTESSTSYCAGGAGVTIGLSNSTTGVNYQLYNGSVTTGSPVPGTGAAISFGAQPIAGTYTVIATNVASGCTNSMTGAATVTVLPLPTAFALTGGGSYCTGTTGVAVGLAGSNTGINYQLLYNNGTTTVTSGTAVTGTGAAISFGPETGVGTYTVLASNSTTTCTVNMPASVNVGVPIALPTQYAVTVSGTGSYCAGGPGLAVTLGGSQTSTNYQLYYLGLPTGMPVAGTGSGISFGNYAGAGAYTVIATNLTTGCTNNMTGSPTISINPLPVVHIMTGGGAYCTVSGATGVAIGLDSSVSGTTYQLYLSGTTVGTAQAGTTPSTPINFGLQTAAGIYTAVATTTVNGCTSNMYGTATVVANALPAVYNVTGSGSYCAGGSGVHVGLSNSAIGVNYQLFTAGSIVGLPVAGTGLPIDFGAVLGTGTVTTYTVVATNAATLCTNNMAGSATVTINPLPVVNTMTGGGSICSGAAGLVIGLSGSAIGTSYQLFNSLTPVGTAVAGTGAAFNFGTFSVAGTYTTVATTAAGCTANMAGSSTITITALPAVNNVTGGGSYCAGGAGVDIRLDGSVIGNRYQLYDSVTGISASVPGTGSPLDFGFETAAGTYKVTATNTASGCSAVMSGAAVVIINPLPALYTVTGGGSYCSGGTGVHVGLGNSAIGVSYQLYAGALSAGPALTGTGAALDFGLQTVAGVYTVKATNLSTGCLNTMTGSVSIAINALPSVYTVSGGGSYCSGSAGAPHIVLSGSNTGFTYQLFLGTAPLATLAGTNLALDFGPQAAAGIYTVVATNTVGRCTAAMLGSATVIVNPLPTVYPVTGGGSYCTAGTGVHVGLGGTDPGTSYQLYNGSLIVGAPITGAGAAIDFGLQTAAGAYSVIATSSTSCVNTMSSSVTVSVNASPVVHTVTGGGSYCAGGTGLNIGLNGSNTGINYQLRMGATLIGIPVTGTGSMLDFGVQSVAGTYRVLATNSATGCTATMTGSATISSTPLPTVYAVSGGGAYCAGGAGVHVGMANSAAGIYYQLYRGTASLGDTLGGTGMALDFGIENAAGTYTVVATDEVSGCMSNMSGSASVIVSPLPVRYPVTGGGSYCASAASTLHIGLPASQFGTNYQLYNGATPSSLIIAGTGIGLDFGVEASAGSYSVVATSASSGCADTMTGTVAIVVNPVPAVNTVSGGGGYCTGGTGVHIFLDGSVAGVSYQLYNGTSTSGSLVAGTGSGLDFGSETAAGAYTVIGSYIATGCTTNMSGTATVSVNPLPTAHAVTGGGSYCYGGPGVSITMAGSDAGVNYQLYRNADTLAGLPASGTGLPINLGVYDLPGTYTAVATNVATGCVSNMTGGTIVSVNALPAIFGVTGGGSYCIGSVGLNIGLSGSTTGITYSLYRGGIALGLPVIGAGSAFNFGVEDVAGVYTVHAFDPVTTCTVNMLTSAAIAVNPLPVVYSVAGGGSYCAGSGGVDVYISNSQTGVSYQLYRGASLSGTPVAGSGSLLHLGLQTASGAYTVVATNTATGCTSSMTGTATVTMNTLPVVYDVTGGGSYCAAGTGVHVGLSGSATGTNYQLYNPAVTGGVVAGTGLRLDFGAELVAGAYKVVATNVVTGCADTMYGAPRVTIDSLPATFSVTGGGNYCSGGSGVAVGLSGSVHGVNYQLYTTPPLTAAGLPVAGSGSVITFGNQTEATSYTVVATNATTGCTSNMTSSAVVTITPSVIPSVAISSSLGDTVCAGTSLTFSTLTINAGSSPTYNWKVNGATSGSGASFTYLPVNGDVVSVTLTSSAACAAPDTAGNSLRVTVAPNVMPGVTIVSNPGDTVCSGVTVNFTATSVNGGSAPAYNWVVNSRTVASGATFSYTPSDNDIVFCKLTSSYSCLLAATAFSNNEVMRVQEAAAVAVTVSVTYGTSAGPVVYGTLFSAAVTNGGFAPNYQWSLNGNVLPGATNAIYTADMLNNGDKVTCFVTANSACGTTTAYNTVTVASSSVGVKTVSNQASDIRLVPNPNKGQFTISGTMGTGNDELQVEITDLLGQIIYQAKIATHNGVVNEMMTLNNNIANGMYLLSIRSTDETKVFHMVVEK